MRAPSLSFAVLQKLDRGHRCRDPRLSSQQSRRTGDLDPSFGSGGKVTTFLENTGDGDDRAYPNHIAVQP
jgi:hypothetical protein